MYYTYVLLSQKDKNLYVGYTDNLKKRIEQHNKGLTKSTSCRRPLVLIYYEACLNQKDAIKREKYFKTGFGRRFLRNRLANFRLAMTGGDNKKKAIKIKDWKKKIK